MFKQLFCRIPCSLLSQSLEKKFISNKATSSILQSSNTFNFFITQRFFSDRRFSAKHEWITLDPNNKSIGTVGISQYAQESLGDVVYVQLPELQSEYNQDDEVGAIESVKAANEIYIPVSGQIVELNKNLEEKPGLINSSCYDEGWLFKIKIKDPKEIDSLMDQKAYEEYLKSI